MRLKAQDIARISRGEIISGDPRSEVYGVSTDSRGTKEGDLFVAITGARTDGHKYLADAIKNGAHAAFISRIPDTNVPADLTRAALIGVDDTLRALQELAAYYRKAFISMPVIGVTGSTGKTTTRQMISLALSAAFRVYSTSGNENSQIGVARTILETDLAAGRACIELGISMPGEMKRLSEITKPDMVVFTNIGESHIEHLGTRANIRFEKLSVTDSMPDGGKLILNGEDDLLKNVDMDFLHSSGLLRDDRRMDIVMYGRGVNACYRAYGYRETPDGLTFIFGAEDEEICQVCLRVHGEHLMLDALAAMTCAVESGMDPSVAAGALADFSPLPGRGEMLRVRGINIINDAYNASPASMKAALRLLDSVKGSGKKIAVLSDMLELGEDELEFHEEIGRFIAKSTSHIDLVLACGRLSEAYMEGMRSGGRHVEGHLYDSYDSLLEAIRTLVSPGDTMLIKASNSMKLWKIPEDLTKLLES